jgi:iron complex outermembrane receptor protein
MKAFNLGINHAPSDYDEYSLGARLKAGYNINSWNKVEAALTYKREDHKGLSDGEEQVHVKEDTWSFGAEYTSKPWAQWTFRAGMGFDSLFPIDYWGEENAFMEALGDYYYIVKTRDMFLYTWQAGVFYKLTSNHELRLTYARKNHFPTMSDRYSTRFGSKLPNSNLGPERANHFELGYRGGFFEKIVISTAVYYSLMEGKIVNITLPDPNYPSAEVDYARNLDAMSFYGFEFSPELYINNYFSAGAALSFNRYVINESQAGVTTIDHYPEFTANAYMMIKPVPAKALLKTKWLKEVSVLPRIEYISERFSDTAGLHPLALYFLAHLKISASITNYFNLSFTVDNIFDEYYEIRENFPLAGRSFNISFEAKY